MKKLLLIAIISSFFSISSFAKAEISSTIVATNIASIADSTEFKEYYGSYKMVDNQMVEKMKIFFKDGELLGEATGYPPTKLTRKKDDEFEESNFGAVITFTRLDGKVTGIKVAVQGQELVGNKE
jgi:hypothetical protein